MRILHVEVGGSYGGSLRALENYLCCSNHARLEHHFLVYYPTPGAEKLQSFVKNFRVRFPNSVAFGAARSKQENSSGLNNALKLWIKRSSVMPYLGQGLLWSRMIRCYPRALRLAKEFRAGNYDLIHVNNTVPYNVEAIIAARSAGIPVACHARNPIEDDFFNRWALSRVCGVAAVNRQLREQLSAWLPGIPVETCYDGVSISTVDQDSVSELRNSLLTSARILICSAGRLDEQKGYDYLVQAARRVLDSRPEVVFVIAGDGPLRAHLEGLIAELHMKEQFRLLGFRQDLQNVIAASDLFVSSSLWEGLPIVAVESVMLSKPLVLTKVGGSPEVVVQGKNGYLVSAADPNALARAILAALENLPTLADGAKEVRDTLIVPMEVRTSAHVLDEFFERVAKSRMC